MKNRKSKTSLLATVAAILIGLAVYLFPELSEVLQPTNVPNEEAVSTPISTSASYPMEVRFIDVGQADCILVRVDGESMLIDAGNNADEALVLKSLQNLGVNKLKYAVGTHPHEDHIGSLDAVIRSIPVEKIIMPNVTANTATFENVINAIEEKHLKITKAKPGTVYPLGEAEVTVLGPVGKYEDLNDWSVVLRVVYKNTSFLFCGDAERSALKDILDTERPVQADVIKMGHHGSANASYAKFLDAVAPQYAVILCEKGNDYGHPHLETMERLKERKIQLFRTDLQGTVTAYSDGQTITWDHTPTKDYSRGQINK